MDISPSLILLCYYFRLLWYSLTNLISIFVHGCCYTFYLHLFFEKGLQCTRKLKVPTSIRFRFKRKFSLILEVSMRMPIRHRLKMICFARFFWTFMRHHKWFRLKFNHLNFDGSFEVVVVQPFRFFHKSCPSYASTLKTGLFLGIASNKILLARSKGCNQWQYMFIRKRLLHFPDKVKAATYFCYFGTLQAKCGDMHSQAT